MKILRRFRRHVRKFLGIGNTPFKKNYSQDGEDILLLSFLEDKKGGFYIDIGAHHPVRFSNTYLFYEKGWSGINIDATPNSMIEFNKIRQRDINIETGIGDSSDELDYYSFCEPALNSFDKTISEERIKKGWKLKEIIKIKLFTINDILNKYIPPQQHIDFITIDIEGLDIVVLRSLNFEKYAPDFFVVEDLGFDGKDIKDVCEKSPIYNFLIQKGYICVARTMRSLIFKRFL